MSFLEETDERPRRSSSRRPPSRGPGVDQQTLWIRRLIALGAGLLVLFLLVWGIHSCQVSQRKNAFRNYGRDVATLMQESQQQSGALFNLLRNPSGNPASPVDVTNNANGVRVQAEQLVDRAKGTSHPGELSTAQRYLLETLEFRRDGIANIATQLRTALGDQGRQQAVTAIAAQMRNFDASDVIYSQRFIPEFQSQLKKQSLAGEVQVPNSAFLPSIDWLDPTNVADQISRIRNGGSGTTGGPVAPGLHGTSLDSVVVKPSGQTLSTTQAVTIPSRNASLDVTGTNGGDNDESNVTVRVSITGAGKPINVEKRVATWPKGTQQTVNIPLVQTPTTGQPVKITVKILPVPGEKKLDNNQATYPAIFTG